MKVLAYFKGILSFLLTLAITLTSFAQENAWQNQAAKSHFNLKHVKFAARDKDLALESRHFLTNKIKNLSSPNSGIKLVHEKSSPVGYHITFIQTYKAIPVNGSSVKLNLGPNNEILSLFHKTANTDEWEIEKFDWENADSLIRAKTEFKGNIKTKPVIYFNGAEAVFAQKARFINDKKGINEEVIYNKALEPLKESDRNLYLNSADTTITGKVFLPNPLKTAKKNYGKPYWDNGDKNNPELNRERKRVQMQVNLPRKDTFYLEGPYVKMKDFSRPDNPVPYSKDRNFEFKRDSSWFEDVNIYYHINRFQEYIQSLGFNNTANYPISVDAHATKWDRSYFSKRVDTNIGKLFFGDGGVDDGEDAETIIHEYSHAISCNVAPRSNLNSGEAGALEEGLADYFACSYSRYLSSFKWERLFFWDAGIMVNGDGKHWPGRWCTTTQKYPDDMGDGKYDDGEIWAGTFMEIWSQIGREKTDKLMLAALHSFSSGMKMNDAAQLFRQADSILYDGEDLWPISSTLAQRGLIDKEYLSIGADEAKNASIEAKAYNNGRNFKVELGRQVTELYVTLQTTAGKILRKKNVRQQSTFTIDHNELAKGIYLIHLRTEREQKILKVIN